MAQEQIEIQVVMDDGSIKNGFANIEKEGNKTAGALSLTYGKLAAIISAVGIGALFKKSISEALQAESALTKFNLALRNNGTFSQAASESFQKFSAGLQAQTGISDGLINSNAALLVSIGRLSGQGLERATKAAVDFSAATGRDLGTSFELLAKATAGSTETLGRYGIRLDQSIPKNERFAAALKLIEERFGGVAEALAASTFEGALRKFQVSFNDILETLGKFITGSPVVRAAINEISNSFNRFNKFLSSINADVVGDSLISFFELLIGVVNRVGPILEVFFRTTLTGLNALVVGFDLAKSGVLTAALAINEFLGRSTDELALKVEESNKNLAASWASLSESAKLSFNTDMSGSFEKWLVDYKNKLDQAKSATSGFRETVNTESAVIDERISALRESAAKNLAQGFVNIVSFTFQKVGASLVKGANAFDDFLKGLGNILGDIAIQTGTTLLTIGLGIDAIRASILGLTGGPAIAAGIALIALGGLLKSLSGGGADSVSGGGVAGGIGGVGATSDTTSLVETEQTKPGTNIEVNISGDVLDSDETGLRIVELINSAFDKQGVTVTGTV